MAQHLSIMHELLDAVAVHQFRPPPGLHAHSVHGEPPSTHPRTPPPPPPHAAHCTQRPTFLFCSPADPLFGTSISHCKLSQHRASRRSLRQPWGYLRGPSQGIPRGTPRRHQRELPTGHPRELPTGWPQALDICHHTVAERRHTPQSPALRVTEPTDSNMPYFMISDRYTVTAYTSWKHVWLIRDTCRSRLFYFVLGNRFSLLL